MLYDFFSRHPNVAYAVLLVACIAIVFGDLLNP